MLGKCSYSVGIVQVLVNFNRFHGSFIKIISGIKLTSPGLIETCVEWESIRYRSRLGNIKIHNFTEKIHRAVTVFYFRCEFFSENRTNTKNELLQTSYQKCY